jgi:hypothetical protein
MNRTSRTIAVAAAVVCGGGVACSASHHASPAPVLPCAVSGVHVAAAVKTGDLQHDRSSAIAALDLRPDASVIRVQSAVVIDSIADKVGLPGGARPMWIVMVKEPAPVYVYGAPARVSGHAGDPELRLVDDATLQPAGSFACGS